MNTSPVATTERPNRSTLVFLLVTAFLNTVGIGLLIPVTVFIVRQYVPDEHNLAIIAGWLTSLYAICQFFAAPGLGALSDRFGRRPVLLVCLLGSAAGYLLFGLGGSLWVLFLGRIIDGLTGGNFSILSAYIADLTAPEERGKYFGMFGAVAGAGFIVGPAIGGFTSTYGYNTPVYLAAGITALSLLWGFFFLPESLRAENRTTQIRLAELNMFTQLRAALSLPQLRWLLSTTFFFSVPFAIMQSTLSVLIIDRLHWNADLVGYLFLTIGVVDILMQGVLAGRLLPIFGEITLCVVGLACEVVSNLSFSALAFVPSPVFVVAGVIMFAVGTGFLEPAFRGLLSRVAGPRQQGVVQGGNQSLQSLALVFGPLLGGALYTQLGAAVPFWVGACVVVLAIICVLLAMPAIRAHGAATKPASV